MACNVTPFLNQKEHLFETSDSEKDNDSSESESITVQSTAGGKQAGTSTRKKKKKCRKRGEARVKNGVITTKGESKKKSLRCYNFSSSEPERLRDVLLTSTELSSSEDDTPEHKDRRIKQMLKEHRLNLKYQKRYDTHNSHQRTYHSSGLLSSVDRYPEYCAKLLGQSPPSKGRVKRKSVDDKGRVIKTRRPPSDRVKAASERKKNAEIERATKELARIATEQAKAALIREKFALNRGRSAAARQKMASLKRGRAESEQGRDDAERDNEVSLGENLFTDATGSRDPMNLLPLPEPMSEPLEVSIDPFEDVNLEWEDPMRSMEFAPLMPNDDDYLTALETGLDSAPETVYSMARSSPVPKVDTRDTEEMAAKRKRVWVKVAKKEVVKVYRKRKAARKEAMFQKKRLAEMCCKHVRGVAFKRKSKIKETNRKLNFLITQTELCAYFMQSKVFYNGENKADLILRRLDEEDDEQIPLYDSTLTKAKASRNARAAFRDQRTSVELFDEHTGVFPEEQVDVEGDDEPQIKGEFKQPSLFTGQLKDYQLKGMNWIAKMYDNGTSGILADEKGLDKIVQCIAFLCHVAERLGVWGPFLVVTSASSLHYWHQLIKRFASHFKVIPYRGNVSERKKLRQCWSQTDLHTRTATFHVVITSHPIIQTDLKYFNSVSWQYMILDEVRAVKTVNNVGWKLLLQFRCRNRLLLLGTIENELEKLWTQLHFIMPALFDSQEFKEWFSANVESHVYDNITKNPQYLSRLQMVLKLFMLRRMKKDVQSELVDKIEIMVHCPLTSRQKLIYNALMNKIPIDDILAGPGSAETGHVKNLFSADLIDSIMQLRKVCNHPDLFERRGAFSPLSWHIDDYNMPKLIAEDGILLWAQATKNHLLFNKLSILTPNYIHESLKESDKRADVEQGSTSLGLFKSDGLFAFSPLMNLSPTEIYEVTLCRWTVVIRHIEAMLRKNQLLYHRLNWWFQTYERQGNSDAPQPSGCYDRMKARDILNICPGGDTLNQKKGDGNIWRDFLFTDQQWMQGGPFNTFANPIPETIGDQMMRLKREQNKNEAWLKMIPNAEDEILSNHPNPRVFPHVERPPIFISKRVTPLPEVLVVAQLKVAADTRALSTVSNAFMNRQRAECADEAEMLTRLVARAMPPLRWHFIQAPGIKQMVSDAGKLKALDSLLDRLKEEGHRVLIYSQMGNMIKLLELYMSYRNHAYMRLDGSRLAARHRIADVQARASVFVFLISTRVHGHTINFTAADTVIFYDSDWNPNVDLKAMERAHRLGQTKQVTVYRLICKETIEESIMQRAIEKSEELLTPGFKPTSTSPGIERMLVSGGSFKLNSLKPQEMLSLLLGDEAVQFKSLQIAERQRREELERKMNAALPSSVAQQSYSTTGRMTCYQGWVAAGSAFSNMRGPLLEDDDSSGSNLIIDIPPPPSPLQEDAPSGSGTSRGSRGRRTRQRGVRNSVYEPAVPTDAGIDSDESLEEEIQVELSRISRMRRHHRELGQRGPYDRRSRPRLMPQSPH